MSVNRMTARLAAATAIVALAIGGSGALAATQMFKCIVGGRTVYQQQACPVDAELANPPGVTAASSPTKAASAASGAAAVHRLKPASRPASSAPATPR
jgi:hypothetical protein